MNFRRHKMKPCPIFFADKIIFEEYMIFDLILLNYIYNDFLSAIY
jgi:hypothetical protein